MLKDSADSAGNAINQWIKTCAIKCNQLFTKNNKYNGELNVDGIIIAGNGELPEKLSKSPDLKHYVKDAVIMILDTTKGGEQGFKQVIDKSCDLLKQYEGGKDDKIIQNVLDLMKNKENMVSVGLKETEKAIKMNAVEYVILATNGPYKFVVKHKRNKCDTMFIKNEIELSQIKRENKRFDKRYDIIPFSMYWRDLCILYNTDLRLIKSNSMIGNEFICGYDGCLGVLYYSMDLLSNSYGNDHDHNQYEHYNDHVLTDGNRSSYNDNNHGRGHGRKNNKNDNNSFDDEKY